MEKFVGPDKITYDLSHLAPFECVGNISIAGEKFEVPILVNFNDHCYTREMEPGDDPAWKIPCKDRADGMFCPVRWTFSCGLKDLVRALIGRGNCYLTTQNGHYFKVQLSNDRNKPADHGWYIFFKLERRRKGLGVALTIKSIHERPNWPTNARGRQYERFGAALAKFVREEPDLREQLVKAKGPQQGGLSFE